MKYKTTHLLVVALCAVTTIVAHANERTETEMKQAAASVLLSRLGNTQRMGTAAQNSDIQLIVKASELTCLKSVNGNPFNIYGLAGGSPGYAIVSTDDSQPALLGYSINGYFQADKIPTNMAAYLNTLCRTKSFAQASTEEDVDVEPLLGDILFHQDSPYNNLLPIYNGTHVSVGCVATAMAQIMAYYKYPERMKGEDISYDAGIVGVWNWSTSETVFQWDKILPDYSGDATDEEIQAVATLAAACSASARTSFIDDEELSGGSNGLASYLALRDYMGYDDGMEYIDSEFFEDFSDFTRLLIQELKAGRPLLMGGGTDDDGHSYVCDGCTYWDGSLYFHINWGEGDDSNDYFLLPQPEHNSEEESIDTDSDDDDMSIYLHNLSTLIGIQPEDGIPAPPSLYYEVLGATNDDPVAGDSVQIVFEKTFDARQQNFRGYIQAYAEKDNVRYPLNRSLTFFLASSPDKFEQADVYVNLKLRDDLPSGTYKLVFTAISEETGREGALYPTVDADYEVTSNTSAIGDVYQETRVGSGVKYTLDGKCLGESAQKGIYIQSGKKYLKR
jgi:hypothetical protein